MMGEKIRIAEQFRFDNAQKWGSYTGPFTSVIIAEMKKDNERIKMLCEAATKEWHEEKKRLKG